MCYIFWISNTKKQGYPVLVLKIQKTFWALIQYKDDILPV